MSEKEKECTNIKLKEFIERSGFTSWLLLSLSFNISKSSLLRCLKDECLTTSLNCSRRFFSFKSIVEKNMDQHGIWNRKSTCVVFSIHGSINSTLLYLVEHSDVGWTEKELENYLNLAPKQNLVDLYRAGKIERRLFKHHFVYFSKKRIAEQLKNRVKKEW